MNWHCISHHPGHLAPWAWHHTERRRMWWWISHLDEERQHLSGRRKKKKKVLKKPPLEKYLIIKKGFFSHPQGPAVWWLPVLSQQRWRPAPGSPGYSVCKPGSCLWERAWTEQEEKEKEKENSYWKSFSTLWLPSTTDWNMWPLEKHDSLTGFTLNDKQPAKFSLTGCFFLVLVFIYCIYIYISFGLFW